MLSPYFHLFQHDPARAADRAAPARPRERKCVRGRSEARTSTAALLAPFIDFGVDFPGDDLLLAGASCSTAPSPPTSPTSARGAVLRAAYDPPLLRHLLPRARRGGAHVPPLRAAGGLRRRAAGRAAPLRERHGRLRRVPRPGRGRSRAVPAPERDPPRGLRRTEWSRCRSGGAPGTLMRRSLGERDARRRPRRRDPGHGRRDPARAPCCGRPPFSTSRPTILYLMGLPVARDMEGRILTEILQDDFMRAHPVTFIPSYESLGRHADHGRGPARAAASAGRVAVIPSGRFGHRRRLPHPGPPRGDRGGGGSTPRRAQARPSRPGGLRGPGPAPLQRADQRPLRALGAGRPAGDRGREPAVGVGRPDWIPRCSSWPSRTARVRTCSSFRSGPSLTAGR